MKKILILSLSLLLLSAFLAACKQKPTTPDVGGSGPSEPVGVDYDSTSVENKSAGITITLGMGMQEVLSLLGEPVSQTEPSEELPYLTLFYPGNESGIPSFLNFEADKLVSMTFYSPDFETGDGYMPGMQVSLVGDDWAGSPGNARTTTLDLYYRYYSSAGQQLPSAQQAEASHINGIYVVKETSTVEAITVSTSAFLPTE